MTEALEFDSIELDLDGRKILSSVYMKCEIGKVVGVLGRNGSGKSCMMKILFGSMDAQHKHVRINGESLPENYLRSRLFSYLPQENLIPSQFSIGEAFKLFNVKVDHVGEFWPEISSSIALKPDRLSGGTRRLVETILVLCSQAPYCLLDEPFTGVMPLYIEKMQEIIKKVKHHKGIILTDHLHRHVTAVADSLYVLSNGCTYPARKIDDLVKFGYLHAMNEGPLPWKAL
ncbi:MAG TPA: ATP-binding cassette domain-containing protein [Chryseosolibacter sp.]|nr:ATP-binding cassette domain-containing protein [Chryseosolibacter sp.]